MDFLATIFLLLALYSTPMPAPAVPVVKPDTQGLESINIYRKEHGLKPVVRNTLVCKYANLRLTQIQSDFSHTQFLSNKDQPKGGTWKENLAKNFPESPLEAWKKSPTHNANLLADVSQMCLVHDGEYWVLEGWHQ